MTAIASEYGVRVLPVRIDNEPAPQLRSVKLRTAALRDGVLCEVGIDSTYELCLVETVSPILSVRRTPSPR